MPASILNSHIFHNLHASRYLPYSFSLNLWLIIYWTVDLSILHPSLSIYVTVVASLLTSLKPQPGIMMLWEWPSKRPMTIDAKFRHWLVKWMPLKELWVCNFRLTQKCKVMMQKPQCLQSIYSWNQEHKKFRKYTACVWKQFNNQSFFHW